MSRLLSDALIVTPSSEHLAGRSVTIRMVDGWMVADIDIPSVRYWNKHGVNVSIGRNISQRESAQFELGPEGKGKDVLSLSIALYQWGSSKTALPKQRQKVDLVGGHAGWLFDSPLEQEAGHYTFYFVWKTPYRWHGEAVGTCVFISVNGAHAPEEVVRRQAVRILSQISIEA